MQNRIDQNRSENFKQDKHKENTTQAHPIVETKDKEKILIEKILKEDDSYIQVGDDRSEP